MNVTTRYNCNKIVKRVKNMQNKSLLYSSVSLQLVPTPIFDVVLPIML